MAVYVTDGFEVHDYDGWFYPMQYSVEMEDFVFFHRADGSEVRFADEAKAIDYLASK